MADCVSLARLRLRAASAGGLGNPAAKVFADQRGSAAGEIAEAVGEIAVVALDQRASNPKFAVPPKTVSRSR